MTLTWKSETDRQICIKQNYVSYYWILADLAAMKKNILLMVIHWHLLQHVSQSPEISNKNRIYITRRSKYQWNNHIEIVWHTKYSISTPQEDGHPPWSCRHRLELIPFHHSCIAIHSWNVLVVLQALIKLNQMNLKFSRTVINLIQAVQHTILWRGEANVKYYWHLPDCHTPLASLELKLDHFFFSTE
jgi:hypothetical protein